MTQQSETQELKPCPWCNGAAMLRNKLEDGRKRDGKTLYWIMCPASLTTTCRVSAKTRLCDTPQEAATLWNTRAPVDSQGAGDFETWWDEYQRPWLPNGIAGYKHAKKAWTAAATKMRTACVEKLNDLLEHEIVGGEARRALIDAVRALSFLTLDQVKQ